MMRKNAVETDAHQSSASRTLAPRGFRFAKWLIVCCCAVLLVEWLLLAGRERWPWAMTTTGFLVCLLAAAGLLVLSHRRVGERVVLEAARADTAREELETAVERLRSIFELHPEAVFAFDTRGNFTAANAASSQVTGHTGAEMVGRSYADVVDGRHHRVLEAAFARVAARETVRVELEIVSATGELIDLDVTGLPIMVGGDVVGCYAIAADVTGRRQLKRDLMRAQLEAEHANEAKSLFLTNVSHEIRTPLTTMLGNFEMLQDTDLDPVQTRFVESIQHSGDRLLSLVTDILDFSRMESGSLALVHHASDLRLVMREAVTIASAGARAKQLDMTCDIDPALPESLMADAARLAQVLASLLDNAVKFTDQGWVQASVTVAEVTAAAVRVEFSIADSGIGIRPSEHSDIFRAFHQVDPTATRRHGGTGLGLASCRRLVEMMGGHLAVSSELGRGSTFVFSVDFARAHARPSVGDAIQGHVRMALAVAQRV